MRFQLSPLLPDSVPSPPRSRLLLKANQFCEKIARQFEPESEKHGDSSASSSGPGGDNTIFTATLSASQPAKGEEKVYIVTIPLVGLIQPGDKCGFPAQPPLNVPISFTIPANAEGQIQVQLKMPKETPASFNLVGLSVITPAATSSIPPPVEVTDDSSSARQPVQSHNLPPKQISDVHSSLSSIHFFPGIAKGDGNCYPYSSMAGFEITKEEAANPTSETIEKVRLTRVAAVDKLCGHAAIGGVISKTVRREEGIKVTSHAAAKQMAPWKKSFHWGGSGKLSAFWQFGTALHLDRPIAVIEKKSEDQYYDPARIYGAKDDSGSLKRTAQSKGKAETVPSYVLSPISDIVDSLSSSPRSMSLISYNGKDHFEPILYKPPSEDLPAPKRQKVTSSVEAKKTAKPPPPPLLPEPDFALDGYNVLPSPVDRDQLPGKLVAHRFSVKDWSPGWCIGTIVKQITGKRWNGQFEVDYGKAFNPPVYIHSLPPEQYGSTKNWVLVEKV